MNNNRDDSHFQQANDRLRNLDRRRYEGQMTHEQYRQERRDILRFLAGEDVPQENESDDDLPEYVPRKRRWWWPMGGSR